MKAFAKLILALCVVTLWPLAAEFGVPGSSVSAADEKKETKTRRTPSITEATYKKLSEAQAFMDLKDYAGAKAVIDDTINSRLKRMNGNEVAQVYNML
ncbi:MAG: tetratricopeptide repeat protein, partial [Proteobacteria bacterium]|nr:tetratricopeptide repeat protein [Pseudomonadota bacterium]